MKDCNKGLKPFSWHNLEDKHAQWTFYLIPSHLEKPSFTQVISPADRADIVQSGL